jgi:group I intron endonuclease
MKNEIKYSVYKHTSPDGKIYIGCTSQRPERRWDNGNGYKHNHKTFFHDIEKIGWDNFTHEIVASDLSESEGFALETELIRKYNTVNPKYGYNKSIGGKGPVGCVHDEEFRRKRSEATRGVNNPMYGKPCEGERRRKISEAHKGMRHTPESIEKMRIVHSKRIMCVETGEVYSSVLEAASAIGAHPQNISAVCCGKQKTCRGYRWLYI